MSAAVEKITSRNIDQVSPAELRAYAQRYVSIEEKLIDALSSFGVPFESEEEAAVRTETRPKRIAELEKLGATVRNNGASLVTGWLSPACGACVTGQDSATYYLSLACHHRCFYCFNPNQRDYELHRKSPRDACGELHAASRAGADLRCIALTGGEPLLRFQDTLAFFETARQLFPRAHLRLYTSGDLLRDSDAKALAAAGLDEIRFGLKPEGDPDVLQRALSALSNARDDIATVVVELPVMPDGLPRMEGLLKDLDRRGADGVNLLELCFPCHNGQAFAERGYRLRRPPFETAYNWGYAGGVPVAGSEEACLDLVEFALRENLKLSAHYCSLENKLSAEVFRLNGNVDAKDLPETFAFSNRDFFLKTLKLFGADTQTAQEVARKAGARCRFDDEYGFLEMHPADAEALRGLGMTGALSTQIAERLADGLAFRELRLDKVDLDRFSQADW